MNPLILGIDPGYGRCGFGLIERMGRDWKYVAHGIVETKANIPLLERFFIIHQDLQQIINDFSITHAAVETLYFSKNTKTALDVAQARGVIMLTLVQNKLPVLEYNPMEIKQTIAGWGKADKSQIHTMVEMFLGQKFNSSIDDAIDALAIALTASRFIK